MLKRLVDITLSILGLIVLFPLVFMIGLIIKIDSKGPVFYLGTRTGYGGASFKIIKFRTMDDNAENSGGLSTAKNDKRITGVGKFLRNTKLDEIPQLINIFKGDMSFVGPRPEMREYTNLYVGEEKKILTVKPGITDYSSIKFSQLGHVLGDKNPDVVYEESIRPVKNALRIKYVNERGMVTDIKILFMTILTVLFKKTWNI